MKLLVLLPFLFSMVSFVLTMLALFAGSHQGFMEEYHIMMFNTSTLGQNFLSDLSKGGDASSTTTTSASATATATSTSDSGWGLPGLFSSVEASATRVVGSIESSAASILNDVGNDVADKLSKELGIEQFYSLHVMDLCQGNFEPNATASGASLNITNCTAPMDYDSMDLTSLLDQQLSIGPFNVSLSDLGFTQKLTNKLKDLPTIFEALTAIYIVAAIFTGLSMIGAAAGLFLLRGNGSGRKIVLANLVLATPAAIILLIGSLMYTIGAKLAVQKIQDMDASDIGLDVTVGSKFQALTWAAFALMAIAMGYWVYEFVTMALAWRRERRMRNRKDDFAMGKFNGQRSSF